MEIEILIGIHTFSLTKMHLNVSVYRMATILSRPQCVNTLRPRQNVHLFADDTFKRIFLNENVWKSIKISLKFVPKGPINNNPALVQIMAWRRSGDKPLSEPMMVSLLTHICVTRPQCVKEVRSLSCCRYFYERCLVWMCYYVVIYRCLHYFVAFSLWIVVSSFTQPIIWCNQGSVTIWCNQGSVTIWRNQGLYSLSGWTPYCKIPWSLEAARFGLGLFQLLWNLTDTSAAAMPKYLPSFRSTRPL